MTSIIESCYAWFGLSSSVKAPETTIPPPTLPNPIHIFHRNGYSLAYDARTKNPIYVYEKLSAQGLQGRVKRDNCKFYEDRSLPDIFRSQLKDYKRSGYDRGHLASAANHKANIEEMTETFCLSNTSPQNHLFNTGYWAQLEKYVRDLTNLYEAVEVYTGPLFLPTTDRDGNKIVSYKVIGGNEVAVPTHFFKVLFLKKSQSVKCECFVLPNSPIPANTPLVRFSESIHKIQKAAGLILSR